MSEKVIYSKAEFLNSQGHEEDASIFTSITEDSFRMKKDKKVEISHWCALKIRDCDKTISLSINLDTPEHYKNSIYKIDKIISHLTKFKDALKKTNDQRTKTQPAPNPSSNSVQG